MHTSDKKFFSKVVAKNKQTIFGTPMPVALVKFEDIPQPVPGLVDSGVIVSLVNPHIAKTAGLKYNPNKDHILGTGAGGKFSYVPANPVDVEIQEITLNITFSVVRDDNFAWPCILGHDFLFRKAKITFKTHKQECNIFFRK